jgi:hypothetical protein
MLDSPLLDITPEQKKELKAEFDKLESVELKHSFWAEKLQWKYYLTAFTEQAKIEEFLINPIERKDIETLNKLIYDDCKLLYQSDFERLIRDKKEKFIKDFETTPDKTNLIEHELKQIDDLVFNKRQVEIFPNQNQHKRPPNLNQYERNVFFIGGFDGYYLRKKEFDWGERNYTAHLLIESLNGIEWAKYREFVKSYKKLDENQTEIKLNGEQKFLLLQYLGFCNEIDDKTKTAKLFDYFIEELKFSTIRPMFSKFNEYENEENLLTLLELFKSIKLKKNALQIQEKIDKLKKKKQTK